jgi:ubiquinone/menaquinone biosynthesis C-methylase UbiE
MAENKSQDSHYIHGTSSQEQDRLSLLNDILNDRSLEQLELRGGERVLDVGCGLAQLSRAMARAVAPGGGKVIGIERSEEQMAAAQRRSPVAAEDDTLELRRGDAFALPLRGDEWGSFDVAHARFLLEHVSDPLAVVRAMARAVRTGGRVVLEDDDHALMTLWPEPPGFRAAWEAYIRSYDRVGNDPYVGRRLVGLLLQAGLSPTRNTWLFFGSCAGHPAFDAYVTNLAGVLSGARSSIIETGLAPEHLDDALDRLQEWKQRRDATLWYGIPWAEGRKPKYET